MWEQAWKTAGKRGDDECPICMCVMKKIPSTPFCLSPGRARNREEAAGTYTPSDSGGKKYDRGEDTDYTRSGAPVAASGVQADSSENGGGISVDSGSQAERPRRRDGSGDQAGGERRRATLLLSCSHVFHRMVRGRAAERGWEQTPVTIVHGRRRDVVGKCVRKRRVRIRHVLNQVFSSSIGRCTTK